MGRGHVGGGMDLAEAQELERRSRVLGDELDEAPRERGVDELPRSEVAVRTRRRTRRVRSALP